MEKDGVVGPANRVGRREVPIPRVMQYTNAVHSACEIR
jgi:hypothetical protein